MVAKVRRNKHRAGGVERSGSGRMEMQESGAMGVHSV